VEGLLEVDVYVDGHFVQPIINNERRRSLGTYDDARLKSKCCHFIDTYMKRRAW